MISRMRLKSFLASLALALCATTMASGQTSSFVYQGRLTEGGTVPTGNYDLQFGLWDSLTSGAQVGSTQTVNTVAVSNGVFTVTIDFGANSFSGASRFLEIGARPAGSGSFTLLAPRQPITSTPYAVRSSSAANADGATNAAQLGGVAASQYVQTSDSRLSDPRPPTGGSSNYIQNAGSQQAASNFNINGNGTASGTLSGNLVNATTQFNLNGSHILSNAGTDNLFAGAGAGAANTSGTDNSFFGSSVGSANTTGILNSFFGRAAGMSNTMGTRNAFFGSSAGSANTTGNTNSFFGHAAGMSNTTGTGNAFFGRDAGQMNTEGGSNSFFGEAAGSKNTVGVTNAFFGGGAGQSNTMGGANAFFGTLAGVSNTAGAQNTAIGFLADVIPGPIFNPTNATAIGARAQVTASNALVLGSIGGVNGATADTNVGIGTTAPNARLHIKANGRNLLLGDAGCGSGDLGIGFGAALSGCANFALLGGPLHTFINRPSGGTIFFREANGDDQVTIKPGGLVTIAGLGTGGTATLCRNASLEIASCSSSLRYKTEVKPFGGGLQLIQRLQPVSFRWKANQQPDIGLVAEEVAQVEPRLTFKNKDGEIEGVNYSQVSAVLINAVKEQQVQIQQQRELIERQQVLANRQQRQLNALKKLACRSHRRAGVCK